MNGGARRRVRLWVAQARYRASVRQVAVLEKQATAATVQALEAFDVWLTTLTADERRALAARAALPEPTIQITFPAFWASEADLPGST